jgi:hypothetical protein
MFTSFIFSSVIEINNLECCGLDNVVQAAFILIFQCFEGVEQIAILLKLSYTAILFR